VYHTMRSMAKTWKMATKLQTCVATISRALSRSLRASKFSFYHSSLRMTSSAHLEC
jgi:hypothetical protein